MLVECPSVRSSSRCPPFRLVLKVMPKKLVLPMAAADTILRPEFRFRVRLNFAPPRLDRYQSRA